MRDFPLIHVGGLLPAELNKFQFISWLLRDTFTRLRSHILTILLCSGFLFAQAAGDEKIYTAGKDGVARPVPVSTPAPPMPNSLKYADVKKGERLQQQVVVIGIVGKDGRFRDLSIQQSAGKKADSVALKTLKDWKFKPCKLEGKPVNCRLPVQVAFNMY